MNETDARRADMVRTQIEARGVRSEPVLEAMRKVPRERFLPERLSGLAYEDTPLPIAADQTISQPYIVAFMTEAMQLEGGERVLEIGTGSGYAAAVLGEIADEVYTVEYIEELADSARKILAELGYDNVLVKQGDGTRGWPEHAPYDAIVVAAGGPKVPDSLKKQLKVGGHLVIPVGKGKGFQQLVRVTRVSDDDYRTDTLADVRFVPLVGVEGWTPPNPGPASSAREPGKSGNDDLAAAIREHADTFESVEDVDLAPLLERIGDAEVVLIGEATHGTSEFYRLRARITAELIREKGFRFVAIEGDWPDAARIDHYVRHFEFPPSEWMAFSRFPKWMWRNREVREFVDWLRNYNKDREEDHRVAFHGLDLYSMYSSIRAVLEYLDDVDPEAARLARELYGCLTPWQSDPATYGRAALSGSYRSCEDAVTKMLIELSEKHREYAEHDGERFLDAVQNARLVAHAERYYRVMYYGSRESWNLRDGYMFDTLKALRRYHEPDNKAVVWAHNSHIGDARATAMSKRDEINIGQLCREEYGDAAFLVGFGTDNGTVAAASNWDGEMEIKRVLPGRAGSYERLFHETGIEGFMLGLKDAANTELVDNLATARLERAIGVIYRPDTELMSHYFKAVLPRQFDEYVWIDTTRAVEPLDAKDLEGMPDTYPFGL